MTLGVLLISFGGFIALMNWLAPIQSKLKGRHVSMVPLFGSVFIAAGIYSVTDSFLWSLIAIPVDLGTLMFFLGLPWLFKELWKTSSFNELVNFYANDNGREVLISLYKNNVVSIHIEFNNTVKPIDSIAIPVSAGFEGKWQLLGDDFLIFEFSQGRKLELNADNDNFFCIETCIEADAEKHTLMGNLTFKQTKNKLEK